MPDLEKPLSYLEWIRSIDTTNIPATKLFDVYNQYLIDWYKEKKKESEYFDSFRTSLFRDLLSEIAINYSSEEERQFLSKIDLSNPVEVDLIVPFFVKRLKEISKYLITKRNQIEHIKHKKNVKGSELGIFTDIKSKILDPLSDTNFTEKYPLANIPALSAVADYIYVELEPLIDEYDSYYDNTENLDISSYVSNDSSYVNAFKSGTESIDKNLWLDMTKAVEELISLKVPVTMVVNNTLTDPGVANTSTFNEIELNYTRGDVSNLPISEFTNQIREIENLNVVAQKRLVEKYGGTKMLYLSTGSTTTNFVSGVLYDPHNKSANYLNRYNSSHPIVPTTQFLKTEKDMGKFFTPDKQGLLNFERLSSFIELDDTKLSVNTCYVYPDIEQFETGRGASLTDTPIIFRYIDDNTAVKGNKSNPYIEGKITNDSRVQKFYPYQSVEETQQLQNLGISRWSDDVDFWEGEQKDIWSKNEIYTKLPLRDFPVSDKQDDLLVSDKNLSHWSTDIYGNEFALFKVTSQTRKNTEQVAGVYANHPSQTAGDTTVPTTTAHFDYPTTKYFDYQLSGSVTKFVSAFNSLTADKTIYEKSRLQSSHLYFRNAHSTIISPASSALSAVFVKYSKDAAIKSEIDSNVVSFDIKNDIIILQTANHLILEKYQYDVDTNTFTSTLPFKVIVSINDTTSPYEKLASYWYDERNHNFYLGKTVIHPFLSGSNYKAIYPEIYVYNDDNITFSKSFSLETLAPLTSSVTDLEENVQSGYNLLRDAGFVIGNTYTTVSITSGMDINITSLDYPIINVNSREYMATMNFTGTDAGDVQYIFNFYFDIRDYKRLGIKQLDCFSPNTNVFNYNLADYNEIVTSYGLPLSATIESVELSRGVLDSKIITLEGFQSSMALNFTSDLTKRFPLVFGTPLSGRHSNPAGYKDLATKSIRMGAGLSASSFHPTSVSPSTEVSDTSIQPYTHNTSMLLLNAPLSGLGKEVVISFDLALYTITSQNSAYAQVAYGN